MTDGLRAGNKSRGASSLKEAIARRERAQYKRVQANKLDYMDTMQESLNKEIQASVFPYWRNHASLKGKSTSFDRSPQLKVPSNGCLILLICFAFRVDFDELSDHSGQPSPQEAPASH